MTLIPGPKTAYTMSTPHEFLSALMCKAIESKPKWFDIQSYERSDHIIDGPSAHIYVPVEKDTFVVTVAVMRRGLTDIVTAHMHNSAVTLQHEKTEQILYLSKEQRAVIMDGNSHNNAAVIPPELALLILQIGLFGQVVFQ